MKSKINNFFEYFPFLINKKLSFFLSQIGELESLLINQNDLKIEKPIFICGLARSGTTAILNLLSNHNDTASFKNKDLPFIKTLFFWNRISNLFYRGVKKKERVHNDGFIVDQNTPEALEELIWRDFLEDYENNGFFNFLEENYSNDKFEKYFLQQIKKILKIRGNKKRYLSKCNYNIFRLKYIKKIFPDSKIIICFRDPIETSLSSVKVHNIFLNLSNENRYFNKRLDMMCHFEFGEQRKTVAKEYTKLNQAQLSNDQYYYLKQWHKTYTMVLNDYKSLNDLIFIDNNTLIHKAGCLNNLLDNLDLDKNQTLDKVQFQKKNKYDKHLSKNKDLYELYNQLKFLEQKTLFKNG